MLYYQSVTKQPIGLRLFRMRQINLFPPISAYVQKTVFRRVSLPL